MTAARLEEAAARYGARAADLVERGGFESFIYETEVGGVRAILRIGHSLRRPPPLVLGELDWLDHLARRGIGVAEPLRSTAGSLVETLTDGHGDAFVLAAFRYARGHEPTPDDWAPPLWERYGRLIGRIHAASRGYAPPDVSIRRPHWDEGEMLDVFAFLPADEPAVRDSLGEVLEHLQGLPRPDEAYGLTHQDAHAGNFHVAGGGAITLFDFDDCCYSWFANDLAIVIFYALSWEGVDDEAAYAREFWRHFWRGYGREHALASHWLEEIPWFLKLRELDVYAVIHRSMDVAALEDPWARRFMAGRRERVNAGTPYIDFDFADV